jgi:N-carbamoyl-L-amino-acid hydrolase
VADVLAKAASHCTRRGLRYTPGRNHARRRRAQRTRPGSNAGSAPCKPPGLPLFRMPSGAGHDAMKLHEVMPQAMLFVRGENAGISHNPLESTTSDDMQLAVDAFSHLLDNWTADSLPRKVYEPPPQRSPDPP